MQKIYEKFSTTAPPKIGKTASKTEINGYIPNQSIYLNWISLKEKQHVTAFEIHLQRPGGSFRYHQLTAELAK